MVLPIVGAGIAAVGRYIASKGVKEAVKKFGKSAVKKAKSAGKAVKDTERGISSRAGSKVVKAEAKKVKAEANKVKSKTTAKDKVKTDAKPSKISRADKDKARRASREEARKADRARASEKKSSPDKSSSSEKPKTTTLETVKGTTTRNRGKGFGLKQESGKMATKAQRAENVASGRKRIGAGIGVASTASMFDGEKTSPVTKPTTPTSNTGRSGLSATQKAPLSTFKPKKPTAKPPLRSPSSDATAKTKAKKDSAKAKKDSANATAGVLSMAKRRKDRKDKAAKQPDYMKYKSIAEAKKAGSSTYSKNGKEMAAVFKEDLAQGESLRDYMNKKTGKTRKASNTPLTELSRNKDGTPADPTEFNRRVKEGTTLVNKKGGSANKLMAGGMTKSAYKAGGKLNMVKGKDGKMVPDYAADGVGKMKKGGGVKKMKKMNMGGMAGMDDAAMMAMKKTRKKPMMPAHKLWAAVLLCP